MNYWFVWIIFVWIIDLNWLLINSSINGKHYYNLCFWLVFHISCLWAPLSKANVEKRNRREEEKIPIFSPKFRGFASFEWVHPTFRLYQSTFGRHSSICDVSQPILPLALRSDPHNRCPDYILPKIIPFFIYIDIFIIYNLYVYKLYKYV